MKMKSGLKKATALFLALTLILGLAGAAWAADEGGGMSEGDMSGATSSEGASEDAAIYITGNAVTETSDGNYSYTSLTTSDEKVIIEGLSMTSGDYTYNGVSVTGSSTVEITGATITLGVDEAIAGTETAGTAVAVDSGTLYIKDSNITVNGAGRYTVACYNDAVMVVSGSSIIAGGDNGADGNTSSVSDPASNAALLVSGTSRSNFSIGASHTFYYDSECIADGWAALSTDSATGTGLELVAYNTYAEATNGGYGTYADTSCRDYLYGVTFNAGELGAIISNNGEITIGSGADAETATTSDGYSVLAYLSKDDETTDEGSVIYGARNAVQMHSPDMMGQGTAGYQAVLTVSNSTLTTVATDKLDATSTYDYYDYGDAVGAYVDYITGSVLLVKSTGAVITLDNVEMYSSNGVLIHTIINSDSMSRFLKSEGYDVEVSMTDMNVEGDIVHDDYQRDLYVTLSNTTITGAITTATADSWEAQWAAYADDDAAYWTQINNDTYITDTHETSITLTNGSTWVVDGASYVTELVIDATSSVEGYAYDENGNAVELTEGTYENLTILAEPLTEISGEVTISEDVTYENGVVITEDAVISADEDGYTVVMTVDGVQYDIEAGTYVGDVVLEYTKYVVDTYGSHGSETEQYMTVALSIKSDEDGNNYIDYEESVESALVGVTFEYDEDGNLIGASGATITSYGEYFGGVRAGESASFTVDDFDVTLYGNGGNDFTGIGAGFAVCDTATLTVNGSSIYTEGALRSACFAGDESALYVNETEIETHSSWLEYGVEVADSSSITTAGMTTPPTGLGVYGNNRANNVVDYASAYYTDCDIYADSWGAMGCDDVESAEDEDQFQVFTDCTIYVANAGYGAYSIGYIWDMVDSTDITVENGLGIVVAAEGSAQLYNGSTITSGRIGIVTHQGMGAVSNIVVTGEGTSVTSEYTAILVKERASAITISDGATLTSTSGAIIQAVENDDSGAGSLQGTETVTVDISDTTLEGDILQSLADVPFTVTITDATVTGAISTATETYANGGTVSTYADVGIITNNVLEATDDELILVLGSGAVWNVTETSYLDSITIADDATVNGTVTVDGVVVTAAGTYEGAVVVSPADGTIDDGTTGDTEVTSYYVISVASSIEIAVGETYALDPSAALVSEEDESQEEGGSDSLDDLDSDMGVDSEDTGSSDDTSSDDSTSDDTSDNSTSDDTTEVNPNVGDDGTGGDSSSAMLSASYADGTISLTASGTADMDSFTYIVTDASGNTIASDTIAGGNTVEIDVSSYTGKITITVSSSNPGPYEGQTQTITVDLSTGEITDSSDDDTASTAAVYATASDTSFEAYVEYLLDFIDYYDLAPETEDVGDSSTMVSDVEALTEDTYEDAAVYEALTDKIGSATGYVAYTFDEFVAAGGYSTDTLYATEYDSSSSDDSGMGGDIPDDLGDTGETEDTEDSGSTDDGTTEETVTDGFAYESADTSIATVSSDGIVTGIAAGETAVTVTYYVDGEAVATAAVAVTVTEASSDDNETPPEIPEDGGGTEGGETEGGETEGEETGGEETEGEETGGEETEGEETEGEGTEETSETSYTDYLASFITANYETIISVYPEYADLSVEELIDILYSGDTDAIETLIANLVAIGAATKEEYEADPDNANMQASVDESDDSSDDTADDSSDDAADDSGDDTADDSGDDTADDSTAEVGDSSSLALWFALAVIAVFGCAVCVFRKREDA